MNKDIRTFEDLLDNFKSFLDFVEEDDFLSDKVHDVFLLHRYTKWAKENEILGAQPNKEYDNIDLYFHTGLSKL